MGRDWPWGGTAHPRLGSGSGHVELTLAINNHPQLRLHPWVGKKLFSDWFIVVRNAGPGFPLGLFGRGDLDKSSVSDHNKPIREKLLAYAVVKALLRVCVNGEREFRFHRGD
ncbi:hypothetical protein TURU_101910 [Turdus rufiventris]|nr:hypothetical protein TURU_101910 [Turdus rufiventris]